MSTDRAQTKIGNGEVGMIPDIEQRTQTAINDFWRYAKWIEIAIVGFCAILCIVLQISWSQKIALSILILGFANALFIFGPIGWSEYKEDCQSSIVNIVCDNFRCVPADEWNVKHFVQYKLAIKVSIYVLMASIVSFIAGASIIRM